MFIVTAFILGLLATALNPCQIAINVSALTYLSNKSKNNGELIRKGIFYSIGRMTTYTVLGLVLLVLWQKGIDTQSVNKLLSRGEDLLPYILLII
ncbi:MAG: sulfite exporter TauE/SafE family protein, partial [Bacteroidaceae bacterium]|nr:sulfite exporter TauE/SafE family protein [Bacteroidaceae bacterium]